MQGLKSMRKERGLTQVAVAQAVDSQQSSVSQWEHGVAFPEKETLDKLCKFFDCKIDDLM